jgi:hypothetical protein
MQSASSLPRAASSTGQCVAGKTRDAFVDLMESSVVISIRGANSGYFGRPFQTAVLIAK